MLHDRERSLHCLWCPQHRRGRNRRSHRLHAYGLAWHYRSVPEHPYYQQRYGWTPEQWPHAMRLGRQTVSLPLSPGLSDADVERVIAAVRRIVGREARA
ncbi:DegT/DnrJ/EryC1/StrS family aminotransferase [Dyella sp.]|uniref:DegT/DnrJ/EryC1/StrS family aminotransferase n=1 Tax=Dyella sp. TaxID=1869338 RepID=UPI002D7A1E51|nr:DegT/DnrJ/EryC1/StrS family aminotransferase [Dyella sp.]HET6430839.1 DegT/DnrJ/EryC1/StrS family aminotransferase [Dyella sp.]